MRTEDVLNRHELEYFNPPRSGLVQQVAAANPAIGSRLHFKRPAAGSLSLGSLQASSVAMSVTDEQFDRAFAEFQEFGPPRRIPIEQRWHDGLRDVDANEYSALRTRCEEIESFAVGVVEQVRDGYMADDVAIRQLAETYPFLTRERLARTWSQAMYFSMK